MADTYLAVIGYGNQYNVQSHSGHYALNIKYHSRYYDMSNEDFEIAFEKAKELFFIKAEYILLSYGFAGYSLDGRSEGWLKPIDIQYNPIKYPADDYLTFEEYISQVKINSMLELVKQQFNNIKQILEKSKNIEQFNELIESYENL
jgi:hypothetical protein